MILNWIKSGDDCKERVQVLFCAYYLDIFLKYIGKLIKNIV